MKVVAYIDESGTHDKTGKSKGSKVVVIAGLVAWRDEWVKFCGEWQSVLNKYSAPYFHFCEFYEASLVFRGKKERTKSFSKNPYREWDLERLDGFMYDLAELAGKGEKLIVGTYVETEKFHDAAVERFARQLPMPADGNPYTHCARMFFEQFPKEISAAWKYWKEPVTIFYDDIEHPGLRHSIVEAHLFNKKKDPRIAELVFANKKHMPHLPLQAADMVAYRLRQIAENALDNKWPEKLSKLDERLLKSIGERFGFRSR